MAVDDLGTGALRVLLRELVGTVPAVAGQTLHERIVERAHVARRHPHLARQDDCAVEAYDVLAATFPAGTLSGAPKPRALRIIDEVEPHRRGIYGGVVGYLDFAGDMDMAIAIRSALLREGTAYVQAGGGIVADSVLEAEALETVNKAAAPLRAALTAAGLRPAAVDAP